VGAIKARRIVWLLAAWFGVCWVMFQLPAVAAVLPEDRADVGYHYYDGGGVEVKGPALLVRKGFADKAAVSASYSVDSISSASVDVVTTASPYKERREERGFGFDYLYRNTLMNVSFSNSKESDYLSRTTSLDVAQEIFGGMTTVNLGYSRSWDTVGRSDDPNFEQSVNRWQFRLGATQVLTSTLLASLNYEAISDEGFLNSPYRSVYVLGTTVPERYPGTRSSHAVAVSVRKYFESRSAGRFEYRYFWDTWEVRADTFEAGYSRYFGSHWLADWHLRRYSQGHALFYNDNFTTETRYMARDKELSTFSSLGLGAKISFTVYEQPGRFQVTLNAAHDFIRFEYDDFSDVRSGKLYSFDADLWQLYVSARF
jgi:hypothetical protein